MAQGGCVRRVIAACACTACVYTGCIYERSDAYIHFTCTQAESSVMLTQALIPVGCSDCFDATDTSAGGLERPCRCNTHLLLSAMSLGSCVPFAVFIPVGMLLFMACSPASSV